MTIPFSLGFFNVLDQLDCLSGGKVKVAPNGNIVRYWQADGTLTNSCSVDVTVDLFVQAGGGGGASVNGGGGGGAGETIREDSVTVPANSTIEIRVGMGGGSGNPGDNGEDSNYWADADGKPLNPFDDDPDDSIGYAVGGGGGGGASSGIGGGSGGGGGGAGTSPSNFGGGGSESGGNNGGPGHVRGCNTACCRRMGGGGGSRHEAGEGGSDSGGGVGGEPYNEPSEKFGFRGGGGGEGGSHRSPFDPINNPDTCDQFGGDISETGGAGDPNGNGGGGGPNATTGGNGIVAVSYENNIPYEPETGDGSLSLDSNGLIFRDQFTAADQDVDGYNGWDATGSSAGRWNIVGNIVEAGWTNFDAQYLLRNLTDQGSVTMQVNTVRRNTDAGGANLIANVTSSPPTTHSEGYRMGAGGFFNINEDSSQLDSYTAESMAQDDWVTIRMIIDTDNEEIRGYLANSITNGQDLSNDLDEILSASYSAPRLTDGYYGLTARDPSDTVDFDLDEFIICGINLTVNNLPTGWSVQMDSQNTILSTDGDTPTVIDVGTWALPGTTLKLYDHNGNLEDSITPAGGIWGGSEFTVNIT